MGSDYFQDTQPTRISQSIFIGLQVLDSSHKEGFMEQRTCGGCTACCKTHGVYELSKDAGIWCPHCEIGKGCKIYSERPTACQEFKCAWLIGVGAPKHRPDKTKIVPEYRSIPGIGMAMWFWEASEEALNSKFTKRWTRRNLRVGNCVMHVPLVGSPKLYLPRGKDVPDASFRMDPSGEEVEIFPFLTGRF